MLENGVPIKFTFGQTNLFIDSIPKLLFRSGINLNSSQTILDRLENKIERRLFTKLRARRIRKVIVGLITGIQRRDQIEEGLARDNVNTRVATLAKLAEKILIAVLRRRRRRADVGCDW